MTAKRTYRVTVSRSAENGIARAPANYDVQLEDRMTVLDALFQIQREHDPSLNFRCACRVGMCGTCAVSVNGIPGLACRTRPSQLKGHGAVTVEPLPHLPVIRDLVVSLDPFFEQWKRVLPRFRPANPESRELARIPATSRFARSTGDKRDCITCGACYAACGIKGSSAEYLGPAALNRALLRILDPRDQAARQRLTIADGERTGVWRCHTQFNCTAVCPKGISLTDSIATLKRLIPRPWSLDHA